MFFYEWLLIITLSIIEFIIVEKYAHQKSKLNLECLICFQLFFSYILLELYEATVLLNTVMSMIREYEKTCPVDDFQFQLSTA